MNEWRSNNHLIIQPVHKVRIQWIPWYILAVHVHRFHIKKFARIPRELINLALKVERLNLSTAVLIRNALALLPDRTGRADEKRKWRSGNGHPFVFRRVAILATLFLYDYARTLRANRPFTGASPDRTFYTRLEHKNARLPEKRRVASLKRILRDLWKRSLHCNPRPPFSSETI